MRYIYYNEPLVVKGLSEEEKQFTYNILRLPKSQYKKLLDILEPTLALHKKGNAGWRNGIIASLKTRPPTGRLYKTLQIFSTCNVQHIYNLVTQLKYMLGN